MKKKCPYYVSGFDNEKRTVFILEIGQWPIRHYVGKGGKSLEDFGKHIMRYYEIGPSLFFNETEIGAKDTVVIVDWEGFSLTQFLHAPTVQYILHHFAAFQKIQDSFAYGYYLNVNAVAGQFLSLVKPILGSALERIEILGTQKNKWLPRILRTINADQLPRKFGGNMKEFKPKELFD